MWRMAGIMQPRAGSIVGVIFGNTGEHELFGELLGEMADRFRVVLHAHVELDNHSHLIVQTPDANLSKAIQWLNPHSSPFWPNFPMI
jgi:REP element-mobilizing transposase RayT